MTELVDVVRKYPIPMPCLMGRRIWVIEARAARKGMQVRILPPPPDIVGRRRVITLAGSNPAAAYSLGDVTRTSAIRPSAICRTFLGGCRCRRLPPRC